MGSHDVFMADIVSVSCREDILDEGRICYDKADLLAYAHGEYFALGEKLGKFGFSTDKKKAVTAPKNKIERKTESKNAEKTEKFPTEVPKKKAHRGQGNPPAPKQKKRGKRPFGKVEKSSIRRGK